MSYDQSVRQLQEVLLNLLNVMKIEHKGNLNSIVEETQKAIKAASLFATVGVSAVSLDIKPAEETLNITSASSQAGEHSADIGVEGTGQENRVILNHRYLVDGLMSVDDERALFRVVSGEAPCIIQPEKTDDYLYIIMPIRQ